MDVRGVELSGVQPEVQASCSSNIYHFYLFNIVGAEVFICCLLYSPLPFCGCKADGDATL